MLIQLKNTKWLYRDSATTSSPGWQRTRTPLQPEGSLSRIRYPPRMLPTFNPYDSQMADRCSQSTTRLSPKPTAKQQEPNNTLPLKLTICVEPHQRKGSNPTSRSKVSIIIIRLPLRPHCSGRGCYPPVSSPSASLLHLAFTKYMAQ